MDDKAVDLLGGDAGPVARCRFLSGEKVDYRSDGGWVQAEVLEDNGRELHLAVRLGPKHTRTSLWVPKDSNSVAWQGTYTGVASPRDAGPPAKLACDRSQSGRVRRRAAEGRAEGDLAASKERVAQLASQLATASAQLVHASSKLTDAVGGELTALHERAAAAESKLQAAAEDAAAVRSQLAAAEAKLQTASVKAAAQRAQLAKAQGAGSGPSRPEAWITSARAALPGLELAYRLLVQTLVAGRYMPSDVDALRAWRELNGVSDEQHQRVRAAGIAAGAEACLRCAGAGGPGPDGREAARARGPRVRRVPGCWRGGAGAGAVRWVAS
jgi:hypothetical protein